MIVTRTRNATVSDVLGATDVSIADRPSPLKPIGTPEPAGFLESAWLSFKTNSITGTAGQAIGERLFGPGGDRDPGFNPYDLMTDDFVQKYPFMMQHFESGRVLDLPNSAAFHYFLARQEEDYNDRQRLAGGSFIGTLAGAIGPDAGLYAFTGGAAVRGVAPFKSMSQGVAGWLRTGNVATRVAKGAALGTVANVSNEGVLEFINPDRNVDERDAFLQAAVWGAALGAGIPAAGKLLGAGREAFVNTAWGRRLQEATKESIAHARPVTEFKAILQASDELLTAQAAEAPTGTKIIAPIITEKSKPVIAAMDAQYLAAGYRLEVMPHPDQKYFDALGSMEEMDGVVGASIVDGTVRHLNVDPLKLVGDQLEPVSEGVLGKFGSALSWFLPGGKMRRMPSGMARLLNATLFDDAALTVGSAQFPAHFEKIVSAEAMKPAVQLLAKQTQMGLAESFDGHFAKAGAKPITGVLSDGTQVTASRRMGFGTFREMVTDAKRQMEENARGASHPMQFDPAVLEAAKKVTAYSRDMLDRLELAGMLKGTRSLTAAQKAMLELQAAQKSAASELDSHVAKAPAGPVVQPRRATKSTPGFKKAYKARLAELEAGNPGGATNKADAVELAKADLQAHFDSAAEAANAEIAAHGVKRAEIETRKTAADEAAKKQAAEVKQIEAMVGAADYYLNRRWLKHKIEGRKDDFTGKLKAQWQKYRGVDYKTGKPLTERPIIDEALDGLEAEERKIIRKLDDESQIPNDNGLAERYEEAVDAYFTRSANGVYDELIDIENTHGVPVVIKTPDPIKARVLQIDETLFRDYLDQDVGRIIGHYDQQLAGRIAVNTTIQRNMDLWAPLVKQLTGEEFDGTLDHIIKAVNRDFDAMLNAAVAKGDNKAADAIRTAQKNMGLIVDRKVSELLGRPPISTGGDAAESGWRALGRSALRMPYMAFMGLQTVTNLMDLAGLVIIGGLDSRKIKMLASQFGKHDGWLPTMSRRGLEAVESAIDQTRHMHLNELMEYPSDTAPPTTAFGKFGSLVDRGTAFAANKFGTITGINWLNRTTRRVAGHLMLDLIVDGAKKMSKAAKLINGGMDQAKAFHQVGIALEDAQRMSRLGFNGEQSDKLLDMLSIHAVDVDGARPWAGDRAKFEAFSGHVNPEYHAWQKADPELFDRLVAAVNSEVNNVIVTPKLLSRPFMNARWVGRALNQFWGFAYGWGNQLAFAVGQRPAGNQAAYLISIVGLGAMADGIHNHITGRRKFEDTASLWSDPKTSMAMLYGAIDRAGVLGWLSRPIGILDKEGIGLNSLFNGDGVSSRYLGNVKGRLGYFSPVGDYADRLMAGTLGNRGERRAWHTLRGTLPYQNLLHIQSVYRLTKQAGLQNPFGGGEGLDLYPLPTKPLNDPADRPGPPEP